MIYHVDSGSFKTLSVSQSIQGTSSFAQTASLAITASFAQTASLVISASYSNTASYSSTSSIAVTASYVSGTVFTSTNPALSSSYAVSSSYSLTASYALNSPTAGGSTLPGGSSGQIQYNNIGVFAGVPVLTYSGGVLKATGSFSGSLTGSVFGTASYANQSITASYALTSAGTITNAVTASYATRTLLKLVQDYENNNRASGTGNGETLAAYGYNSTTAAAAFPLTNAKWGSISTSTTYDSCVWQEMLLDLANRITGTIYSADNRRYVLNHKIYLPATSSILDAATNPYMYNVDGRGCLISDIRTGTEASGALFSKMPVSSSNANNIDIEYSWAIQNMRLYGPGMISSSAFQIGSGKRCLFYNLDMINYHTGFIASQLLNSVFDRINTQCEIGVKMIEGWWVGAIPSETVSQITINNSRFRTDSSSSIGLYISNCDSTEGSKLQFEGASGSYGLYYDSLSGASTVKNAYFKNLRFETETKYQSALIGFKGRDTFNFIAELGWHQCTQPGTYLIETEAYDGTNPTVVLKYFDNNGGNGAWKINNLNQGTCFDLTSVRLPGAPATAADILSSGDTIFNGTMPSSNRLRYIPPMPT